MSAERKLETYRNHKLLSAEHGGKFVGRIWKDDVLLNQMEGLEVDTLLQELRDAVDTRIADLARKNGDVIPEAELTRAFQKIIDRLSDGQRAMLKAHYHAPNQTLTASELARAAGWTGWSPANLHYGNLGAMLFDEAPIKVLERKDGSLVMTSYLAVAGGDGTESEWQWKLRPEVARVIEHFGLHV